MEAAFSDGTITGNGGIPLLAEVDRQLGLIRSVSGYLGDARRQASWASTVYRICSGRARVCVGLGTRGDWNDHEEKLFSLFE